MNGFVLKGIPALLCAVFAAAVPAGASTIPLSSNGSFVLAQGQELIVTFSVWNYGVNNPGSSPYPTSIGLELLGANPPNSTLAGVPGSNGKYFPGYLLEGTLESLDGSVSAPLLSPDAGPLGLAAGSLVFTPASIYGIGAGSAAAVIDAQAALTTSLSQQIFGPNVTSRQSAALIVLQNLGPDLVIGMNGLSLANAITEPDVTGLGNVETAGITSRLTIASVPEPGTFLLTAIIVIGFGFVLYRGSRV